MHPDPFLVQQGLVGDSCCLELRALQADVGSSVGALSCR